MTQSKVEVKFSSARKKFVFTLTPETGTPGFAALTEKKARELLKALERELMHHDNWKLQQQTVKDWPTKRDACVLDYRDEHTRLIASGWEQTDYVGVIMYTRQNYRITLRAREFGFEAEVECELPQPVLMGKEPSRWVCLVREPAGRSAAHYNSTLRGCAVPLPHAMVRLMRTSVESLFFNSLHLPHLRSMPHLEFVTRDQLRFNTLGDFLLTQLTPLTIPAGNQETT